MSPEIPTATHQTLVFERRFGAAPRAVFAAYADVEKRARWSAPSDTAAVEYSSSEFTVDGVDQFRCGSRDQLQFHGTVRYLQIIPDRRIVYCEAIDTHDSRIAVSLVTWELTAEAGGTRLVVTDQVASFVGNEMIDGSRRGMEAALDNLMNSLREHD